MAKNKPRKYTSINEQDFKNVKLLQQANLRISEASRITGRSDGTIGKIYKVNSLEEYKERFYGPKTEEPKLASTETLHQAIRQAKAKGAILMTTHAAFNGFDDLYDFVKEASDEGVTITFAPMNK